MPFKSDGVEVIAVDDQEDILELTKLFLERFEEDLEVETTTDPEKVLEDVEEGLYDAVLSDYDMPRITGLDLLEEVREIDEDLPFILYTGKGSEEIAADAVNHGVTDYFRKEAGSDHYQMIAKSLTDAVDKYRNAKEREVFEAIVDNSENPILITDPESEILYVNPALLEVTGYDSEELLGENLSKITPGESYAALYEASEDAKVLEAQDVRGLKKNGDSYSQDQQIIPIKGKDGWPEFYASISDLLEPSETE
ncbi:response regulator [Candidatus Nanohalovita haloferacivicina]|uniref:response regulator n=1 Tax=Candidatus Nanohalovita haloferacivicina TaxID=2978046 RepID=UPI00325F9974|nr:Signal transduction histidine kinase, contains REC and PAS domains [Candidatus Nanohalobia archaeon BNXNv]